MLDRKRIRVLPLLLGLQTALVSAWHGLVVTQRITKRIERSPHKLTLTQQQFDLSWSWRAPPQNARGIKPLHASAAKDSDDGLSQLRLFNSLTLQKDPFRSILPKKVSMYTCGPTVYDFAHVGNFRAFLTYDLIKRVLLYQGYDVDHICNLTDVDDKIIKRCEEQKVSLLELTRKYEDLFMKDLEALNIIPAR
jgi:hypothetical protein